ncbi:MAG: hypothetical protein CGU28_11485 [Candidatus Dactylopiibacterium carminicum]|uniref:DUF5680 domain-containing protein n=1 Tax=Candidatus Dactylopiibacterium carminicum TaxID=857335 RepID=A0A272EQ56_9RHOO|nr:DUF5680 domain-containing protein [Candidatus Dactylopiibacterium carminicum]KAF7598513.1 hypothetical protein BGI27_12805 [Candidatus Dactylopiibacterium carminicum]PAS92255.1 MAG: hypothetical protein CGU29_12410 [Candidatus Dactylopiibacterium carminicum]PAS95770.1 MAG: hypothetical protein CGU28_11485 [Candidatus Dactylopiibacterium carminicum]PAS98000.1 MAG: hypothetical protein BSR46_12825 [Candidatus Dactylopiibacterium carminicum]
MTLLASSEFARFLKAAKQATYAGQNDAASVAPLLPGSKQLEFAEGDFFYRDVYVGMCRFVGQEIVYLSGKPVWSMSYSGGLLPDTPQAAAKVIYAFLRTALRALPAAFPVRGPASFEVGSYRYVCQYSGCLGAFQGHEIISGTGFPVYELHFSGGLLA